MFLIKPKIKAQVNSAAGLALISVPQTIIFFNWAAFKSIALFREPEVIIYFNLGSSLINNLVIGVLSRMMKIASNFSSSKMASLSFKNGSVKTVNSNLGL